MGNIFGSKGKCDMYGSGGQLSDYQITQNINQLINTKKANNMTSDVLTYEPNLLNTQIGTGYDTLNTSTDVPNFNITRKRYKEYENKIRELLQKQSGGGCGCGTTGSVEELEQLRDVIKQNPEQNVNLNTITQLLQMQSGGGEDTSPVEIPEDSDEELEDLRDVVSESDDVDKKEKKIKDSEDKSESIEPTEEDSEHMTANEDKIKYSETSFDSNYSDIKVLPFYSSSNSSEYSFRHPYIKNRFY